jgi:hypothetical protein
MDARRAAAEQVVGQCQGHEVCYFIDLNLLLTNGMAISWSWAQADTTRLRSSSPFVCCRAHRCCAFPGLRGLVSSWFSQLEPQGERFCAHWAWDTMGNVKVRLPCLSVDVCSFPSSGSSSELELLEIMAVRTLAVCSNIIMVFSVLQSF